MEHSLKNKILVAMPDMGDERFKQAVVYICDHDEKGAMGLIINKLLGHVGLEDLLEQIAQEIKTHAIDEIDVFFGGPVETDRGFVLHSNEQTYDSTVKLTPDLFMTGTIDIVQAMAHNNGPEKILFALGYASWEGGQLELEMVQNAWLVCEPDTDILFQIATDEKWDYAMKKIGIDPKLFSPTAGHA